MSNQQDRINLLLSTIEIEQLIKPLSTHFDKISSLFLEGKEQDKARVTIANFLVDYVAITPEILFTIIKLAEKLDLNDAVGNSFNFAVTFLDDTLSKKLPITDIEDPPLLLLTLLQACYLVNRIIEEVDDKIESFIGIPLSPMNLMYANIIAHEVIGDRFANRLDANLKEVIKPSVITKGLLEANLRILDIKSRRAAGESLSGEKVICLAQSYGLSVI